MSILSPSDFNSSTPYEIANFTDAATAERIQGAINQYEPEFYKLLLGDTLYGEVTADPPTKDAAILTATKRQAAQYVYWFYRTITFSQTTQVGEVQSASENSVLISPIEKMVFNWNEMVKANRFLVDHWDVSTYGEYYNHSWWSSYPYLWQQSCMSIFKTQNVWGL